MTDAETMATIRITWDAAPEPIVQAAELLVLEAAYPPAAGDPAELEGFRL